MKEIKRIYMERPASGSRTIKSCLAAKGHTVARCRVARLMRLQNLRAIYPKKRRTSSPGKGHKIYPYLLKTMTIDRPGQAYAADITYIPMARGVRISMDGKGRWIDNVYVERFWRSLKVKEINLHAYATPAEARERIADYIRYFN